MYQMTIEFANDNRKWWMDLGSRGIYVSTLKSGKRRRNEKNLHKVRVLTPAVPMMKRVMMMIVVRMMMWCDQVKINKLWADVIKLKCRNAAVTQLSSMQNFAQNFTLGYQLFMVMNISVQQNRLFWITYSIF